MLPSGFEESGRLVVVVVDRQNLREAIGITVLVEFDGPADPLIIDIGRAAAVGKDVSSRLIGGDRLPLGPRHITDTSPRAAGMNSSAA